MTQVLFLLATAFSPILIAECRVALRTPQPLDRDSDFVVSFEKCPQIADDAFHGTIVVLNGAASGEFVNTPSPRTATYRFSSNSLDEKLAVTLKATWDRLATFHNRQPQKMSLALRNPSGKLFAVGDTDIVTSLAVHEVKLVGDETSAGLGEMVDVRFHQDTYLRKVLDLDSLQDLILFFNGQPVGAYEATAQGGLVRFRLGVAGWSLDQSKALQASWKRLITDLTDDEPVAVAVGTLKGGPMLHSVEKLKFDRFDNSQVAGGVIVSVVILLVFGIGLAKYNLAVLRQEGVLPQGVSGQKAFSLARCQMAWWFFLVLLVVVLHWSFVGELALLPPNILLLIGVSAGTGYLARAVDGDKALVAEPSKGFLTDLLTSNGEPGLHRLQMIVWTIVLGSYFVGKFLQTLWAPDLDLNWIGLMGLVSGVYVGFKIPEKK